MTQTLTPNKDLPTLVEGDDYSVPVSFRDGAGDPIPIGDWTVTLTIADRQTNGGGIVTQQTNTTHADAAGGRTDFAILGGDTAGNTGTKRYDIEVEKGDNTTKTVVIGTVAFADGVTDSAASAPSSSGGGSSALGISVAMADGEIAVSVTDVGTFTAADAVAAMDGATISPAVVQSEELLLNQYASTDAAPAGSGPGIIGVTDDGHILVEDGK